MEKQYKYSLQKGSSKSICPECGKKTFVRYIDNVTGECLSSQFGRCDRESKCGYHNKPVFEKSQSYNSYTTCTPKPAPKLLTPIPFEVLAGTLDNYEQNTFIQNLLKRVTFQFEAYEIENVIAQYYLGTVASGAVAFPFIDIQNNIRAIQVKRFDETNHTTKTTFLHSIIKYQHEQRDEKLPDWLIAYEKNELKISCLFGEHLLNKYPLNPVALVEAPKSAIYSTLYFGLPNVPERFLWLAVYNLSSLNVEKCKALRGREVVLFPDLSKDGKAFELWSNKAQELNIKIQGAKFTISDLLETKASEAERLNGCDLADYLICKDWRLFRESEKSEKCEDETKEYFCHPQNEIKPASEKSEKCELQTKHFLFTPQNELPTKDDWTQQINELEKFFAVVEVANKSIKLNPWSIITNISIFIESHISTVKANNGHKYFLPYLNRLQTLKQILSI